MTIAAIHLYSDLLNPERLNFAGGLSARIARFKSTNGFFKLRSMLRLATQEAKEMQMFLQDLLALFNDAAFVWEQVSDSFAEKAQGVLRDYLDIYHAACAMESKSRLLNRLIGFDTYVETCSKNIGLISEILLLLDEDRNDVLAAQASLSSGSAVLSLEAVLRGLDQAA